MSVRYFDVTNLNGFNGFRVPSTTTASLGYAVSSAGDINRDGLADAVITGTQVYVIFGTKTLSPAVFDLNTLNGRNGFIINPAAPNSKFGYTLAHLDFNQDGFSDLVIGASDVNISDALPGAGQSYIIYGKREFRPSIDVRDLDGTDGFTINGSIPFARSGTAVATLGDVNSDGYPDLGIGAPNANNNAGISYVLFGTNAALPASISLATLNGINGFTIIDTTFNELFGCNIAGIGDVNHDRVPDIGIGACGNNIAGKAYAVFGTNSFPATFRLDTLNGRNGFSMQGQNVFGSAISSAGDINLDGIGDFIIGDSTGRVAYTIFGKEVFPASITINTGTIANFGFSVKADSGDRGYFCGTAVSSIKNFFGGQEDSIMVGAPVYRYGWIAYGFVFMMQQNANYSGNINVQNTPFDALGFNDQAVGWDSTNFFGSTLDDLGDFNGDNITDIIFGRQAISGRDNAFVVFGSPFFLE